MAIETMALKGNIVDANPPIGVDFPDGLTWFLTILSVDGHGEKEGHCNEVGECELHDASRCVMNKNEMK